MNKDSEILTKIFNMADEMGLYCTISKNKGEVSTIFVAGETFFRSDCACKYIHTAGGNKYTYKDLKRHILDYKKELNNDNAR